jgi:hypothetical protein
VVTELKGAGIVNRTGDENAPAANFFKYTVTDPIDYLTVIVDQPATILYYEWNASPTLGSNHEWHYNQLPAITFPNPNGGFLSFFPPTL